MNYKILAFVLFTNLATSASTQADELITDIDTESFSCAQELLPTIDILGRGSDFPAFLIEDVERELVRQDSKSKLLKIKCTGEPEITGVFEDVQHEGTAQSALDQLNVSFPVEMLVFTGEVNWIMHVKQTYKVSGLSTTSPKVLQKFEVLKTLNEDGSELRGGIIRVQPTPQ